MLNFENSLIFQIEQFRIFDHFLNQSIIAILKMANYPNYNFWEFSKLDIFGIYIFFLIWKIIRIPKFQNMKFQNFMFYCSDSRKFGRSIFASSFIFKFEISVILKFYCSKFWPSPEQPIYRNFENLKMKLISERKIRVIFYIKFRFHFYVYLNCSNIQNSYMII